MATKASHRTQESNLERTFLEFGDRALEIQSHLQFASTKAPRNLTEELKQLKSEMDECQKTVKKTQLTSAHGNNLLNSMFMADLKYKQARESIDRAISYSKTTKFLCGVTVLGTVAAFRDQLVKVAPSSIQTVLKPWVAYAEKQGVTLFMALKNADYRAMASSGLEIITNWSSKLISELQSTKDTVWEWSGEPVHPDYPTINRRMLVAGVAATGAVAYVAKKCLFRPKEEKNGKFSYGVRPGDLQQQPSHAKKKVN